MLKKMIGAIKAGQAYLGWDDALYRQTLARLTGKTSTTRCNLDELRIIREYMHEQGFPRKAPAGKGRRPRVAMSRKSVLSKIERCWLMPVVPGRMQKDWHLTCISNM